MLRITFYNLMYILTGKRYTSIDGVHDNFSTIFLAIKERMDNEGITEVPYFDLSENEYLDTALGKDFLRVLYSTYKMWDCNLYLNYPSLQEILADPKILREVFIECHRFFGKIIGRFNETSIDMAHYLRGSSLEDILLKLDENQNSTTSEYEETGINSAEDIPQNAIDTRPDISQYTPSNTTSRNMHQYKNTIKVSKPYDIRARIKAVKKFAKVYKEWIDQFDDFFCPEAL